MKTMISGAIALLAVALFANHADGTRRGQSAGGSTSQASARRAANTLGRQHDARSRRGHRAHQRLRGKHRACVRRRQRAHQHVRRQDVRKGRRRRVPHLPVGGDRLSPAGLFRVPDVSRISSPGRSAVLRFGVLRVRGGGRRGRRHGGGRGNCFLEHGRRDIERVRRRSGHRQREHGSGNRHGLQRRRRHRCRDGEPPRAGTWVMGMKYSNLPAGCAMPQCAGERPITFAATPGSSRRSARTASFTRWCRRPDLASASAQCRCGAERGSSDSIGARGITRPFGGGTGHDGCSVTCSIPNSPASSRCAAASTRGHVEPSSRVSARRAQHNPRSCSTHGGRGLR